jgi:chromosome segregation protein
MNLNSTDIPVELENELLPENKADLGRIRQEQKNAEDHISNNTTRILEEKGNGRKIRDDQMAQTEENLEKVKNLMDEMRKEMDKLQNLENKRQELREHHVNLVKDLDRNVNELHEQSLEMKMLENEIQQNDAIKQQLNAEKDKLEQQINEIRYKENEMINERNKFELSLYGLQELIRQANQELRDNQEKLNTEREELTRIESQIEELNRKITEIENEIKQINRDLDTFKDQQQRLMIEQRNLEQKQVELDFTITQLNNLLKDKEAGLVRIQINMEKYQENINQINKQIENLR